MPGTAVIGRELELGAIEKFLDRVPTGPGALVLSGEAGIGKTVLWEAGTARGSKRLDRVLTCHGIEAEAALSFAALSDLLGDVLEEAGHSLAPPRRRALEVALLLAEPGEVAPDPHAIGLAVLDVLRALAGRGTVLIALDDAQWLDPASAAVIQIALRRLREESVGVLATLRTAPELQEPFDFERVFPDGRLEQLSLGPLSLGAVHGLLRERLGLELTRGELGRVQEATAGNPFFAIELGRELIRMNKRPSVGEALPMPESLQELLGERLARLPTHTGDVLLQTAALARPTVELVTRAHGDRKLVLEALEAALREGVVELDESSIRFTHPLLASICYEQAPIWKRRAVHRALADVVMDPEERARHLALAAEGPDERIALELDGAAERAAARGAPRAAGELYELAARLTLDDLKHAQLRRLQAAKYHRLAGNVEGAVALLEQLLQDVPAGGARADVLFELALTYKADLPGTIELLDAAFDEAEGDDARSARILGFKSVHRQLEVDVRSALADAREALAMAERTGDPVLIATAIARVGHAETSTAEITPGLLERGAELEQELGLRLEFLNSPQFHLGRLAMRLGHLDRSRTILEHLEAAAAARGDEISRVVLRFYLSIVEWFAGRWSAAIAHAVVAREAGEQAQFTHTRIWEGRVLTLVEADLGLIEDARARAEEALELARTMGQDAFSLQILGVLGRIELELGDLPAAGTYLRNLPEQLLAGGWTDPVQPMWADAIETLVGLGELERARVYLEQYQVNALRLGSPWAIAAALRSSGLLMTAEGTLAAAIGAFERSLAELAEYPFPLERARTLLCLGTARRQAQQKRAAREALDQALAIFEELGARLWAEKARAELRRISGRRPAEDELTETERHVAELAAQGRTNKEIAAELFMGVSTVESHLSRVYRKLGVRRAELAGKLAPLEGNPPKAMDEAAQL